MWYLSQNFLILKKIFNSLKLIIILAISYWLERVTLTTNLNVETLTPMLFYLGERPLKKELCSGGTPPNASCTLVRRQRDTRCTPVAVSKERRTYCRATKAPSWYNDLGLTVSKPIRNKLISFKYDLLLNYDSTCIAIYFLFVQSTGFLTIIWWWYSETNYLTLSQSKGYIICCSDVSWLHACIYKWRIKEYPLQLKGKVFLKKL